MTELTVDATISSGDFRVEARFRTDAGITALFGPSGAGKSLTLAAIAGLLRPTTGTITLDRRPVADAERGLHVPSQERGVGMVFQHAALLPHRTPLDNVALAAPGRSRAERRAHAWAWVERVGAASLIDVPTRSLSGGEQQRIALARALVSDPALVLLDEPFSALDATTRTELRGLLTRLTKERRLTALLVTHDLEDVAHLADRIVRFAPGRTVDTIEVGASGIDLERLLSDP